ncbi:MAG: DUF4292 domain-containing protein [candidate division KSB1 bacterium]|nr:DUF4292 domain-containing protein [candidate division KSB1 bacterium]
MKRNNNHKWLVGQSIKPIVLFCLLGVIGCAPFYRRETLDLNRITLQEIKARVESNFLELEGLKGKAQVTIEMPGAAYNAFSTVTLKMPDSLLIKIEVIFGIDVGCFFADRKNFSIYSPFQNKIYNGALDSLDLSRFFQIELNYDDLLEIFSGVPRISEGNSYHLSIDNGRYVLLTQADHGVRKYWIDPKKFVITNYQLFDSKGTLLLTKEFHQFKKEAGVFLPRSIKVERPGAKERFTLFYTDRQTNAKIASEDFQLKVPHNAEKIKL